MELKDLEKVNPMTVNFHGLSVTFNPDAFTAPFFYAIAEQFKTRFGGMLEAAEIEAAPDDDEDDPSPTNAAAAIERVAQRFRQRGEYIDHERALYTALLIGLPESPVLLSWDLTDQGHAVPCNEEGLRQFKKVETLRGLWETVRDAPDPKLQGIGTIPQNQTTSETTQSPSASPETPADDTRIM